MSKTRIAPDLREFVEDWLDVDGNDLSKPNRYRAVTGDLNALLAVARAAQSAIDVEERLAGVSILADPSSFTDADVRTARALSRLRGAARKVGP